MYRFHSLFSLCYAIILGIVFAVTTGVAATKSSAPSSHGESVRFAVLADLHISPGSPAEQNLREVVQEINADSSLQWVIVDGDLSNSGSNAELDAVKAALDQLQIPVYVIPGNHETNWSQSAGLRILENWGDDRFFFRHGNFLFIGFSSGPYMKMGDSNVKSQDIAWIDQMLQQEVRPGDQVIGVAHCIFTGDQGAMGNWAAVLDVFKKYPTLATLHGHFHSYQLRNLDGIPGIMLRSLAMGDNIGYSIVTLDAEHIRVDNKILGKPLADSPIYDIAFANPEALKNLPVPSRPDPQRFTVQPESATVEKIYDGGVSMFSGVAVHDGQLYTADSQGVVRAVDPQGRTRWEYDTGKPLYSTPVYADGKIILGTTENPRLIALDAQTGKLLWQVPAVAPVVNDLLVRDGWVYGGAGLQKFMRIRLSDGRVDWSFDQAQGTFQARPALADDLVVFGVWDHHLYALDAQTGKLRWQWDQGRPGVLHSPGNVIPAITEKQVIFVAPDRFMTALDRNSGATVWRVNNHKYRESMGQSPDGKTIYAKTMDGELVAVAADEPEFHEKWVCLTDMGYEHTPSPVVQLGEYVFFASRLGMLYCVDAATGKLLWQYNCGNSQVNGYTVDEAGNLYFSLIEGTVYRVALKALPQ